MTMPAPLPKIRIFKDPNIKNQLSADISKSTILPRMKMKVPNDKYSHLTTDEARITAAEKWAKKEYLRRAKIKRWGPNALDRQMAEVNSGDTTLNDVMAAFCLAPDVKESSAQAYLHTYNRHVRELLGCMFIRDIRIQDLDRLKANILQAEIGNGTAYNVMSNLRSVMKWAHRRDYIEVLPAFPRMKAVRRKHAFNPDEFFSDDEVSRMITACRTDEDRAVILLGLDAGLRRGEILGLRFSDIDVQNRKINVLRQMSAKGKLSDPKGGETRQVGASRRLIEVLERLQKLGGQYVLNHVSVKSKRNYVYVIFDAVIERANVRKSKMHRMRHTCASRIAKETNNVFAVKQHLGHVNIETSMRYIHVYYDVTSVFDAYEKRDRHLKAV